MIVFLILLLCAIIIHRAFILPVLKLSPKRLHRWVRYMALSAHTSKRVLHANGLYCTRSHMAGNAVVSHLQVMRDRGRSIREIRAA